MVVNHGDANLTPPGRFAISRCLPTARSESLDSGSTAEAGLATEVVERSTARRLPSGAVREITPAGETVRPFLNPLRAVLHLWHHRDLIHQLTVRDLVARYRGSFLGVLWSLLLPLLMLCVYTFVFSMVFTARWGTQPDGRGQVALILFAGLIPYNFFAEMIGGAPVLVISNPSYVKRVVFPLEVLPLVKLGSALFQAFVSAGVLLVAVLLARHSLSPTVLLMPVAWIPLVILALGATYALAALGVFVRDVGQAVTVILPFLFFLTPIVYPLEAVPAAFQVFAWMNPIAHVVEDARRTAIFAMMPKWRAFAINCTLSSALAFASFLFFMRSKRHFHDAL